MELTAWRKQWRKIWDNPLFARHPNRGWVWMWILDHAMWEDGAKVRFNNKTIELKKGQLTCGAHQIANETGVPRGTVERIIKLLESEEQLRKETDMRCSLITVVNWESYQGDQRKSEEVVRKYRGSGEEVVRTKEEDKETKEDKEHSPTESEAHTPGQQAKMFFETPEIQQKAVEFFTAKGMAEVSARTEIQKFILYWTEPTATGKHQRWQKQPTFDVRRRLVTWFNNNNGFKKSTHSPIEQL